MGRVKELLMEENGHTCCGAVKRDTGLSNEKPNLTLFSQRALEEASKAMIDGSRKYGAFKFDSHSQRDHIAGAMRHLSRYLEGEDRASDSNIHHLGHALARCSIALDQALRDVNDDRRNKS